MGRSLRPMLSHVHRYETKLENQIQGLVTTDIAPIDSGEMLNTQKKYWNELDIYGLDYDNQPSLVNGLPSPGVNGASPSELDLDAAHKQFKEYFEAQHQKYLELKRLELSPESQVKFDMFVRKNSWEGLEKIQSRRIEAIGSQVLDDLKLENDYQIDAEHLEQQKAMNEMRFNLGLWQEEATLNLESAHTQAVDNLRQGNDLQIDYDHLNQQ